MPSFTRVQTNQDAARTIEQFTPMINKYAFKFLQRANGLGASMDLDDIRQELSLIFIRCTRSYDETKGGSFMNFVISAWFNEMNRLMRKDQRNVNVGHTLSDSQWGEDDEQMDGSIFDRVDSGAPTPEQNVEALQLLNATLNGLSAPARTLVSALLDPPDELCRQFEIQASGIKERRDRNVTNRNAYTQMNLRFLFEVFGIPRVPAMNLKQEIESRVGHVFDFAR